MSIGSDMSVQADSRWRWSLSRYMLAGALVAAVVVGIVALLLSAGGQSSPASDTVQAGVAKTSTVAGSVPTTPTRSAGAAGTRTHAHTGSTGTAASGTAIHSNGTAGHTNGGATASAHAERADVAEVRDPEEAKSFPLPASVRHASASAPSVAAAAVAPGAATDAQIRKELGEEQHAEAQERAVQRQTLTPVSGGFSVGGNGTIPIPTDAPEAVQRVVAGGNAIADFPYIWGGGHASFIANGYDCSGSVSYALAAGGLLKAPLVSGDLASWGDPGPGRWITIYANAGHTFMDVNGVWFDTAGRSGPYASRWLVSTPPLQGYAVRHPPGY